MKNRPILVAAALVAFQTLGAQSLTNGDFKVNLAPTFPGVLSYTYRGQTVTLPVNANPVVLINDQPWRPEVTFVATGPTTVEYHLSFKEMGVTLTACVSLSPNALTMTLTDIRETGSIRVRTLEIPDLTLLAGDGDADVALGNFPEASYASEEVEDHDLFGKVATLASTDNTRNKHKNRNDRGERGASYAFVSNGKLAAGLTTNVMEENLRMVVKTSGPEKARTLAVAPGRWTWREVPHLTSPDPFVTLVVAADRNGDGLVTWQDAALAYRENIAKPYGAEKTKAYPIAHIAMNFASQATNPFLRVLDNAKKVWLYTDGMGQRIQQKGFAGEGHDSSHPDYGGNVGRRQGGREDLNFVARRGHDFDILTGVHINAHEYHLEAKHFRPDIVNMDAVGWAWLDESYLTDYRYDSAYGTLYQRLEGMKEDLPFLDFVYLDVYYGRGWPGWRMWSKTNALGLMQHTEFPGTMERGAIWTHVANDWTQQIGGKGDRSEIARFIHYSEKDTFLHEPLLRGSNCDGFMGWHAEQSLLQTLESAFTVNLPTKYLQHFSLLRSEKNKAYFSDGVRTEVDGQVARIFGQGGRLVNTCRYEKEGSRPVDNLCFIPWGDAKIYHWNDKGGDSTWEVPATWAGVQTCQLYRLTDLGRVFVREVPVVDGRAALTGIQAKTPYVLYRETPMALPDMKWGEGGLVRDPGFDSHGFASWKKSEGAEGVSIENTNLGQTELVMKGQGAASVSQVITALKPGKTYAASVWLSIAGKRPATLEVSGAAPEPPPFKDRAAWMVLNAPRSVRGQGAARMFDGDPKTCYRTLKPEEAAKPIGHNVASPANARVRRPELILGLGAEQTVSGFSLIAPADSGEGTLKTFEAYTSMDNKTWQKAAAGTLSYDAEARATVQFAKPVKAKYFRLVATTEKKNDSTFAIAELDLLTEGLSRKVAPLMAPVSNMVDATALLNYTDQSSKYLRNWHRLKVSFTAPADGRAVLTLATAADGKGTEVRFDDVRLVASGISKAPATAKKVILFEDFENVDEGWGPFMYGWEGPMNTHLSEANPPYTKDVIGGTFSLKSRLEDSPGMLFRTVPATLKLKADTSYRVSFDYLNDTADLFALAAGTDGEKGQEISTKQMIGTAEGRAKRFTGTIKTDGRSGWFIGITKVLPAAALDAPKPEGQGSQKAGTIVIDNLLVEEI